MGFIRQEMPLETLLARYLVPESRLLNIGSKARRVWPNSVNLDISAGENVDVVGDAHDLPFPEGDFDACVLYAMLQYAERPWRVVEEAARVLRPGGMIFVDVPFLQPYCAEPPVFDRFRFTKFGLEGLVQPAFDVLESGVTIATGSVLAQLGRATADTWSRNRYVSALLRRSAILALWPVGALRFAARPETAGGFYLVGRRADRPHPGAADLPRAVTAPTPS